MFGDNFSGWVSGRMGQIHLGRANPFGALVAGLVAGEFLLFREAVDDRLCRCCRKRFILHRYRPRALPNAAPRPGLLHQAHVPQRLRRVCGRAHKTAFEWRYRVLATVFGYQDRIVLRDTVWVYDLVLPTRMLILKS